MFALTKSNPMSKTSSQASPSAGGAASGWEQHPHIKQSNRHHPLQYSASHLGCSTSMNSGASGPKVTKKSATLSGFDAVDGNSPTRMTTSKTMADGSFAVSDANLGFFGRLKKKLRLRMNKGSYNLCQEKLSNAGQFMARSESEIYDNSHHNQLSWKETKLRSESLPRARQSPFVALKKNNHRASSSFRGRHFSDNQNIVDSSWLTEETNELDIRSRCPLLDETGVIRNDFLTSDESAIDLDLEPVMNHDPFDDEPGYESLDAIKLKMQLHKLQNPIPTVPERPELPNMNESCCNNQSQLLSPESLRSPSCCVCLKTADHVNQNCPNGTDNMCECTKQAAAAAGDGEGHAAADDHKSDMDYECHTSSSSSSSSTSSLSTTTTTTLQSLNCCRSRTATENKPNLCLNLPTLQFACPSRDPTMEDLSPDQSNLANDDLYANPQVLIRKKSKSGHSFKDADRTSRVSSCGVSMADTDFRVSDSNGNSNENVVADVPMEVPQIEAAPPLPARNYRPEENNVVTDNSQLSDATLDWCNDNTKHPPLDNNIAASVESIVNNSCLSDSEPCLPPPLPPENGKKKLTNGNPELSHNANVIPTMTKLKLHDRQPLASSMEELLREPIHPSTSTTCINSSSSSSSLLKEHVIEEPIHASLDEVFPTMRRQRKPGRSKLTASWNGERSYPNHAGPWDLFAKGTFPKSLSSPKVMDEPIHASLDEVFPDRRKHGSQSWKHNGRSSWNGGSSNRLNSDSNWEVVVQERGSNTTFGCTQMFPSVNGVINPDIPPPLPAKRKTNQSCLASCKSGSLSHDVMKNLDQLRNCGWYWGPLTYEGAKALLDTKPDGSFLLRDSSDDCYILSLSFKSNGKVYHTRMEHHKGLFSFSSQPESHQRCMIKDFMEQAMQNSEDGKFLYFLQAPGPGMPPVPIRLLHPVSRFYAVNSLMHLCRFSILGFVRRDLIDDLPIPESLKVYLKESQYFVESVQ